MKTSIELYKDLAIARKNRDELISHASYNKSIYMKKYGKIIAEIESCLAGKTKCTPVESPVVIPRDILVEKLGLYF
jgi:hypothetical protein